MKKYIRVVDPNFNDFIPFETKGIYFLHSLDNNELPIPTQRLLGIDEKGILYIGSTPKRTLHQRLADFRKVVLQNYNGSGHIAGRKYNKLKSFMDHFPVSR